MFEAVGLIHHFLYDFIEGLCRPFFLQDLVILSFFGLCAGLDVGLYNPFKAINAASAT